MSQPISHLLQIAETTIVSLCILVFHMLTLAVLSLAAGNFLPAGTRWGGN